MKLAIPSTVFLCVTALTVACAPVTNTRGYIADPALESSVRPGTDTKQTIQDRLGYASTTATFGGDNPAPAILPRCPARGSMQSADHSLCEWHKYLRYLWPPPAGGAGLGPP